MEQAHPLFGYRLCYLTIADTVAAYLRRVVAVKPGRKLAPQSLELQVRFFKHANVFGKIAPKTRLVDLDADRKRFWLGKIQSVNDKVCNNSTPISLNHFKKEEI